MVVYNLDRLHRRPVELEHFITLADQHRTALASVSGEVDLSTDGGRLHARILGAVARAEIERKSARQTAAYRQRAQQGRLHRLQPAFGYRGLQLEPVEAQAVRDAVGWVHDGVSLYEIARRWTARGLTTALGNPWEGSTVATYLRNPRVAGIRTYRREPVVVDGEYVRGEWEPLLDVDTWQAMTAALASRGHRWPERQQQLLLSGVARCGTCGNRINSGGKRQGNSVGHRYRCVKNGSHINRTAAPVDEFVVDALVARLGQPDTVDVLSAAPTVDVGGLRVEATQLHQRMEGLSEAYADGAISVGQLRAGTERLRGQLAEVERRLQSGQRSAATARLVASSDVRAAWDALEISVQRTVLRELAGITMHGPGAGIRYVTAEQVVIDWL
ncbi:Resolvase, N terminal domain [Auraticoccus monumenti]|uniref:Resolvase, N terminal domain n=1 Tax=Auraticoccus monumenti TaxID=675864 RepID=A0A1G6UF42_9ACTN|nr:Resolvase, N terminal domain [Auraticoccus monumenti]